jgi:methionyl-tRNA synthetase
VVYVWVDALINYISGLGYPSSDAVALRWNPEVEKIHVIGKNVWKFHAIYWPALLLSAGLDLPDTVLVHGFLTNNGKKISKSDGTAIHPSHYVRRFGADAIRYYLLGYVRPFEDTDFAESHLERVYSADLANNLGNLLTRLTALCETAEAQGIEATDVPDAPEGYHEALSEFRFDRALGLLFAELSSINRDLAKGRPWDLFKVGRTTEANENLGCWAVRLHAAAYWLEPFLPRASSAIQDALRSPRITKAKSLFPRLPS